MSREEEEEYRETTRIRKEQNDADDGKGRKL